MAEQQMPLNFAEILKEVRKLLIYNGDNSEYALTTWLEETSTLLQLVQTRSQQLYILRLILYKLQGEARSVAQKIQDPTWNTIRHILVTTFGVHETYGILVNRIHKVSSRNIGDAYHNLNKLLNKLNTKFVLDPQRELHLEFNSIRNENLVLNKFKSLLPEYKAYLIEMKDCEKLSQAYNLLREMEQNNQYRNNNYQNNNNYQTNSHSNNRYSNSRQNNNRYNNHSNIFQNGSNNNQNFNRNYNQNYNPNRNRMQVDHQFRVSTKTKQSREKLFEGLKNEEAINLQRIVNEYETLFYKEGENRPAHEKEVEYQINDMLKQGTIKPWHSPYNAPIWVVPKKVDNSGKQK
ncbi:GATA zinc finger domain-containing protein 14-like [Hermetia illucens]|uniref:GATA zinc finger domain-containing protein 14-like n=1 Tax=Hermetia illucens TaxID=343691 RepID=UPI0018CC0FD7|nr:GATA zinc finger domain-containing protein 14-like [Hermetia illucens]